MEKHIKTRYSLQNFPRHHEQYIDYFLTDYVVEKARVPSVWWNFGEKVRSGDALVYTPSNDWNRRHIQSDHYSKYAFQKASRKILILSPRYTWQIYDIISEKRCSFLCSDGK